MKLMLTLFLLLITSTTAYAQRSQVEDFYVNIWCDEQQGVQEVRTSRNTRIDCLTEEFAVEVDFDTKWAEGLGQALHYAAETGLRPAVLLIIQNHNGRDRSAYLDRLQSTIDFHRMDVTVFVIETKNHELRD
jgi:hypothetical protein